MDHLGLKVTCFAEAGGQHVSAMARAVEELGIRACLTRSTMDCGEGLPPTWASETTESCLQVKHSNSNSYRLLFIFFFISALTLCAVVL